MGRHHAKNLISFILHEIGAENSRCNTLEVGIFENTNPFSLINLIAKVFTDAQADQSVSNSVVAPSLLGIYFDIELEQPTLKCTGGLCKALLKAICIADRCSDYHSIYFRITQRFSVCHSSIFRCSIWFQVDYLFKIIQRKKVRLCEITKITCCRSFTTNHGHYWKLQILSITILQTIVSRKDSVRLSHAKQKPSAQ